MATPPDKPVQEPEHKPSAAATEESLPVVKKPAKTKLPVADADDAPVAKRKAAPKPPAKRRAPARPKPEAPKKAGATHTARSATSEKGRKSPISDPKIRRGGMIAGAVGAVATAGAAIFLALRKRKPSSSAKIPAQPKDHAHQADGTDSSAEFDARIADEGMVPDVRT